MTHPSTSRKGPDVATAFPTTPCILNDCTEPSHILLFAQERPRSAGPLRGRLTGTGFRRGEPVPLCLRHAHDVLVCHRLADGRLTTNGDEPFPHEVADWIWDAGWGYTSVPAVRAPYHAKSDPNPTSWRSGQKPARARAGAAERAPYPRRQR